MSTDLLAVVIGVCFTIAMATTPDLTTLQIVNYTAWAGTVFFALWWLRRYRAGLRKRDALRKNVTAQLDVLSPEERAALTQLVLDGWDRQRTLLAGVESKTSLITRDFAGHFFVVAKFDATLLDVLSA